MKNTVLWLIVAFLLVPAESRAAMPLITDDTETQGAGKFEVELSGLYDRDRETETGVQVRERDFTVSATVTFGIIDTVDLFVGIPYSWTTQTIDGSGTSTAVGASDTRIGAKWRFWGEKEGASLALRPSFTLPTGDYEQQLGAGRVTSSVYVISTYASDLWAVHVNAGYARNENLIGERKNLWHASAAATIDLSKRLKICADIGVDTNRDIASEVEPAYALAGLIYSIKGNLEVSIGLKSSLNKPASDWTALPGLTYHF